jgi:hypothetical protein
VILKEFEIKELKMNGMKVGFEKAKVVVEVEHIKVYGAVAMRRLEWRLNVDYIETNLEHFYKHIRGIDLELTTVEGKLLSGRAIVSGMEEKVFTELTGIGELIGSGVK